VPLPRRGSSSGAAARPARPRTTTPPWRSLRPAGVSRRLAP